jgi:putative ABC transport system ATP-binding protein
MHIKIENLSKNYEEHNVVALSNLSLTIERGEFIAVMGPSGCGKSSFLNLLAGIDRPSSGSIFFGDTEITKLNDAQLTLLRRDKIGFVFQFFNLLSTLTAAENVALPLDLAGKMSGAEIEKSCNEILDRVGLLARRNFFPSQMSGGEMQRVAIARAIIHKPELIVADEPTGNLDTETGEKVLQLLRDLCRERNHTVIMATHSLESASFADRTIHIRDGRLQEITAK